MTRTVGQSLTSRKEHYDRVDWSVVEAYQLEVRRDLLALLPDDVSTILDVGCGNGFLTNALPERCRSVGVDISAVALRNLARPGCLASAIQLPFADRAFDLVMANDVLEHLPESEFIAALSELERVAKRYIITTVPFAEDLGAGRRYSAQEDTFYHVNEHVRAFDAPAVRALYTGFDLDAMVFSGVEWSRESRTVEALRALSAELGAAPLADHPAESVLSDNDRAEILKLLRADQARALGSVPEIVDFCRLRTEIIGLHRRRPTCTGEPRPFNAIRTSGREASAIPTAQVDLNVVDFSHLHRHRQPWLPIMARFPYLFTAATVDVTPTGARFAPLEASRSWDLKLGFFCDFEGKGQLEIIGVAEGEATLSIAHYGAAHEYRSLQTTKVSGEFCLAVDDDSLTHSQYGMLFEVSVTGGNLLLKTVRLVRSDPLRRLIYTRPIEYLHVADDGVDYYLSCHFYGPEVPVLEWFETPGRMLLNARHRQPEDRRLATEIAAVLKVVAAHCCGRFAQLAADLQPQALDNKQNGAQIETPPANPLVEEVRRVNEALTDQQRQIGEQRRQITDLTAMLQAQVLAQRKNLAEIEDRFAKNFNEVAAQTEAAVQKTNLIDGLAGRLASLEMMPECLGRVDDAVNRQETTLQSLTVQWHNTAEAALRSEVLAKDVAHRVHILERVFSPILPAAHILSRARHRLRSKISWPRYPRLMRVPGCAPSSQPPAGCSRRVVMLVADDRIDHRVLAQARSLVSQGWRVTVIGAPYPGTVDADQAAYPEVSITRIDTNAAVPPVVMSRKTRLRSDRNWKEAFFYNDHFLDRALQYPAEIVTAHDLPVLPAAIAAADYFGARLIYDAHELYPEQHHFGSARTELYREIEAEIISAADAVTTVNESIACEMADRYGIAKPRVVLNAPEIDPASLPMARGNLLREKLRLSRDRRILLFQGALSINRNLENLTRAMARVRTPDVVLVFMGPGLEKRAELSGIAAADGALGSRVFFLDAVGQSELLEHTASADVGVIPYPPIDLNSRYCTPNKLFELIVAGVPILANDLPELRRYVHDTGFGQVHRMDDPGEIAAAIDKMFNSDLGAYRRALHSRCEEFTWERQAPTILDLYQAVALANSIG